jgi:serine/threonine-protein kinase HipA
MPVDRCNVLFYPRKAKEPLLAGELRLLPGVKGSVFQYSRDFIANPGAIALDPFALPLQPQEWVTIRNGDSLVPDAFLDAGPDAWGRTVIDRLGGLERSSEFDYLVAAGPNRVGALHFSGEGALRIPAVNNINDLKDIENGIDRLRKKLPIEERIRRLLVPGTSIGGMRPKTVVEAEGHLWIAKFNSRDEDFDAVSMEYAGMRLAARCGLDIAEVRKQEFGDQRLALLVRRFDREPIGEGQFGRIPYISARTLLRGYSRQNLGEASGEFSYVVLAEVRRLIGAENVLSNDLRELFRRIIFNILIDNTDDHERNQGFVHDGDRGWRLSKGFDIASQLTNIGYQGMEVGTSGSEATLVNALSECNRFGIDNEEANALVEELIRGTEALGTVYRDAGVDPSRVEKAARSRERIVAEFQKADNRKSRVKRKTAIRKSS